MAQNEASGGQAEARAQYDEALAEFTSELKQLHIGAGAPSLRTMARRGSSMSASNLSEILNGKRLPSREVTLDLVRVLQDFTAVDGMDERVRVAEAARVLAHWRARWEQVKTFERRADSLARKARAAATHTAEEIIAAAKQQAERLKAEAVAQARRDVDVRRSEAEAVCAEMIAQAGRDAAQIRDQADRDAAGLRHQAAVARAEAERLREEAQKFVAERTTAARIIQLAKETADQAIAEARQEGEKLLSGASERAGRILAEARAEERNVDRLARTMERISYLYHPRRAAETVTARIVEVVEQGAVVRLEGGVALEGFVPLRSTEVRRMRAGETILVKVLDLRSPTPPILFLQKVGGPSLSP